MRTWDELKEYVMVQGLMEAESTREDAITQITNEGIQVLMLLLFHAEGLADKEGAPIAYLAISTAAEAIMQRWPEAHEALGFDE